MDAKKVPVPGSERHPLGTRVGEVPKHELVEVSVILKPRERAAIPQPGEPAITRAQFAAEYGADPAAIAQVEAFAAAHGLTVADVFPARRTVKLQGTIAQLTAAFGARLEIYEHAGEQYRARTGSIHVPAELASSVEAVLGLDNRLQARAHFRVRPPFSPHAAPAVSYTPPQVAALYQFPSNADGTGQTIGIIELGGGYNPADLTAYFSGLGIPEPSVISVSVDGGTNQPTTPDSADGEVLLDIEVAGAVAPGAQVVVYFAPNTDQGFQDALTMAIHDSVNNPSVISISWGSAESTWTGQAVTAFDSAAQDAAAIGVTICAAAGDNGSSDGVPTGGNHVDFPASSPHILACGGTNLQSANGTVTSETVWNEGAKGGATGGGFSAIFPLPDWQASAGITGSGRGVPDISGDADPETGYQVLVDGQSLVIGGTSAVAPLWSGLIALLNQQLGQSVGFLQPALYALQQPAAALNDITSGSNGAFQAGPGWDACTGLGSPSGQRLLTALGGNAPGAPVT